MDIKWDISVSTLVSVGSILLVVWKIHSTNIKKIQDIETKLDMMFDWFKDAIIGTTRK
jgi:hypothetical protein